MSLTGWILLSLALLLAGALIYYYNRFVQASHEVKAAWSDIAVQLKRRHGLLPKLVEAVRACTAYEQATRRAVTRSRDLLESLTPGEVAEGETGVTREVRTLLALAEAYPELKASDRFLQLMQVLSDVEQHIQYARRYYNGCVRELNVLRESVPANLVAALFRIPGAVYFELPLASEGQSPALDFGASS